MLRFLCLAMLLFSLSAPSPAQAQGAWPSRQPIRLVVPWPPGGVADYLARQVGDSLGRNLGQQVLVENRPGAATNLGSEQVAKAAPDGYTLLLASTANAANMTLFRKLGYDTANDFAAVALLGYTPMVLVVNPGVPAQDLRQFLEVAKKASPKLAYASAGAGSPAHLAGEQFKRAASLELLHVPYKGAGPAVTDLIGGQVQALITNVPAIIGAVKGGKLRALGITGAARNPALPDVPTFAEAGLPQYDATGWYGIVAPRGTPPELVGRLAGEIAKVLREPAMAREVLMRGVDVQLVLADAFQKLIRDDIVAYRKLIQDAGITAE